MGSHKETGKMANELAELVETNIHGYIQQELAELKACAPDVESKKRYFKKHVGAYYRAMNETVGIEQKIKAGGFGNATTKNLTINLNNMGLVDKQRLLAEMTAELKEVGEKMGYSRDIEAKVVPIDKGKNRIKADGNDD